VLRQQPFRQIVHGVHVPGAIVVADAGKGRQKCPINLFQWKRFDDLRLDPKLFGGDKGLGRLLSQGDGLIGEQFGCFLPGHYCLLALAVATYPQTTF
jgi:hypothetical protein